MHMVKTFEVLVKEGMVVDDAVAQVWRVWSRFDWDVCKWGYSYDECPWRFAVARGFYMVTGLALKLLSVNIHEKIIVTSTTIS